MNVTKYLEPQLRVLTKSCLLAEDSGVPLRLVLLQFQSIATLILNERIHVQTAAKGSRKFLFEYKHISQSCSLVNPCVPESRLQYLSKK